MGTVRGERRNRLVSRRLAAAALVAALAGTLSLAATGGAGQASELGAAATSPTTINNPLTLQSQRAAAMRRCLTSAGHQRRSRRARARAACMQRYGRTPGPITEVFSGGLTATSIGISFMAPGTDGGIPPPAVGYLVKQSLKPIRTWREFQAAQTLCGGDCRFSNVVHVGDFVALNITGLKPYVPYYYTFAPRDNVSLRCGATVFATATPGDIMMPGPGMHTVVNPLPLGFHPAPPCGRSSWVPQSASVSATLVHN